MKKLIFLILFSVALFSCDKEEETTVPSNTGINGSWKLTAYYNDPGDGSGSFTTVNSNKKLTFTASNSVTSNASICNQIDNNGSPSQAAFSLSDSTITGISCDSTLKLFFSVENTNTLDVFYPCIEPCIARYTRE